MRDISGDEQQSYRGKSCPQGCRVSMPWQVPKTCRNAARGSSASGGWVPIEKTG